MGWPRIQAFDSSGQFFGQARGPVFVGSDRSDRDGRRPSRARSTPSTPAKTSRSTSSKNPNSRPKGPREATRIAARSIENATAKHVAADPTSDKIWVLDRNTSDFEFQGQNHVCGETSNIDHPPGLIAFDHLGHELDCSVPQGLGAITTGSGLVVTTERPRLHLDRKENRIKVYRLPEETAPTAGGGAVSQITQKSAQMHGEVGPGFEPTEWGFEYGTSPCSSSTCTKVAGGTVYGLKMRAVELSVRASSRGRSTTTGWSRRIRSAPTPGPNTHSRTFPFIDLVKDACANALARKQTRTAGLLDCRAYELASAGFTGGYDVISDLAPGQVPFEGLPGRHGQGPLLGPGRRHPGHRQPDQPRPRPLCRGPRRRQRTAGSPNTSASPPT